MDQYAQMKTMLKSFLGSRQETTSTAFCDYLESEVEDLEVRDFQTFGNKAVKLLMGYSAGQRKGIISHSNLHFLGALVPLPNMCHRLIISSGQRSLPGNTSGLIQKPRGQQSRSCMQLNRPKWWQEDSNSPQSTRLHT